MTVVSAALCILWLMSDAGSSSVVDNAAGGTSSELALVNDSETTGALATLDGSPAFQAQFRERADACSRPLAWVAVSAPAGQVPTKIRLKSGSYISPEFSLSDRPVRIAVPYPAPYEAGRGSLTIFHTGGDAVIGLRPAWHVSREAGSMTHAVTWPSTGRCMKPNG
ncbi:hypothetical protein [Rhodopila sp.]|uniref:hypothetical protein n=1 Tax=Rhodopila sp. TaxID=2480087 RepID=UPI003D13A660